jgi:hypothetical protein
VSGLLAQAGRDRVTNADIRPVYSTCLFCRGALGSNEVIERFPVGRRLAFDGEKGRLWVVCTACGRWNLTPLEERWEAVEDCERRFRATRLRTSTDQIGLARLAEGLTLIRIGRPLRPEFAAWRYSDHIDRRRRRQLLMTGVVVTAVGFVVAGELAAGVAVGTSLSLLINLAGRAVYGSPGKVLARIPRADASEPIIVRRRDLAKLRLANADYGRPGWGLLIGEDRVSGAAAERTLASLLPSINRFGGTREQLSNAVSLIGQHPTPADYVRVAISTRLRHPAASIVDDIVRRPALGLMAHERLALEMALHEDEEQRAMGGELAGLEAAWREAEEIAAIADDMFLPESVTAWLQRHRGPG